MRILREISIVAMLLLALPLPVAKARMATQDEALIVATSWIARIIDQEGHWGKADQPEILGIQPFMRNGRILGYFCPVQPVGFIVISLYKELAPVKAYSTGSNLDGNSEEGMADLLKTKMEGILEAREGPKVQSMSATVPDLQDLPGPDFCGAWAELLYGQARAFSLGFEVDLAPNGVTQIGPLLSSSWHQLDPYNLQCPPATGGCGESRCAVGCVALAGAQIMRYWAWPPYKVGSSSSDAYDWTHMANEYKWNDWWEDEKGNPLSDAYLQVVAGLCREIGDAVRMVYCAEGCGSGANPFDMNDVLESHYRYSLEGRWGDRAHNNNPVQWFNFMKEQFNANRPVYYNITKHSLVADGWKEEIIGGVLTREYHMNYGFKDTSSNAWYTLDHLPESDDIRSESMGIDIYPAPALGTNLGTSRWYGRDPFNYRYFDQDATGTNVTFAPGQNLQFLPKVKVTCSGTSDSTIKFLGQDPNGTRLFSVQGTQLAGISVQKGGIVLHGSGGIRFH